MSDKYNINVIQKILQELTGVQLAILAQDVCNIPIGNATWLIATKEQKIRLIVNSGNLNDLLIYVNRLSPSVYLRYAADIYEQPYKKNRQHLRELLSAAFSSGEITTLAFDLFYDVYCNFSSSLTTNDKIKMILDAAETDPTNTAKLLNYVKVRNSYQYDKFLEKLSKK